MLALSVVVGPPVIIVVVNVTVDDDELRAAREASQLPRGLGRLAAAAAAAAARTAAAATGEIGTHLRVSSDCQPASQSVGLSECSVVRWLTVVLRRAIVSRGALRLLLLLLARCHAKPE